MPSKHQDRTGDRLLRILDEPLGKGETVLGRLDDLGRESGQPPHATLLKMLTHQHCGQEAARQIWTGFEVHRATLQRRLSRDVGARVALFDYLINIEKRLANPMLVEMSEYERTERSAITDHLTGLFNRAHFDGCLRREVNRCRRYGQSASLILMDLDDFKTVNDKFGHPAGDAVLRDMGRLLIQRVRDIDIAARYGGEEFAVILPETRRTSAFVVAERIRAEVERYFKRRTIGGLSLSVTVSGGISGFPEDADTLEEFVEKADRALYRAKRGGKNAISIFFREKRRANRVEIDSRAVRVTLNGQRGSERSLRAVNISSKGMLLESSQPLRLGQSLDLSLVSGADDAVSLTCEVVRLETRLNAKRRKVYDAGVRFRFGRRAMPHALSRLLRANASN